MENSDIKNISVLGFGSWGIALALQLYKNGYNVTAYQRSREKCERIRADGVSAEYLPGTKIPPEIKLTSDIADTAGSDMVIFTAGSKATRELAERIKPFAAENQIFVNASKGLEPGTNKRMSEVIKDVIPGAVRVAAMSGPCHAEELCAGIASAYVAASPDPETAKAIQNVFMSKEFRIYTNPDIIGVELGGALKQCIAMSVGICDGMGYGDNTRAVLITRGIVEISRLGLAMGAKIETFSGLSGIGDLVVTCTSELSRNKRAGFYIGQGMSLQEALDKVKMIVEAVNNVGPALAFAKKHNIEMPITEELYKVLYEGKDPKMTVKSLMERDRTDERVLLI